MSGDRTAQKFGGPWSLIKTEMVEKYVRFFNTALKEKPSKDRPFERVYIDAFAGTGAFTYVKEDSQVSLFGPRDPSKDIHDGSALRALRAEPPFDRIIFIEAEKDNVEALRALIKRSGHPNATVEHGDANQILKTLCAREAWKNRRGVIFLDPFGMNVEWSTLQAIAATKALDVWFLFALAGTVRNLPRVASQLDASKRSAVTRVLGTEEWFDRFYKTIPSRQNTVWGAPAPAVVRRTATVNDIEAYVRERLRTIFSHVEPPRRLKGPGNKSLFSLFFAVANPAAGAVRLAQRGASHILKS